MDRNWLTLTNWLCSHIPARSTGRQNATPKSMSLYIQLQYLFILSYFRGKSVVTPGVLETNPHTRENSHSHQGNNRAISEENSCQDTAQRHSVYDLLPPNEGGPPSYTDIETDKV